MGLGEGLAVLAAGLGARGARLILRRGAAREVLLRLVAETGAAAVHWQRVYDREGIARDTAVKAALKAEGILAESFPGAVLFEPWTVATGAGAPHSVYSPFWRAVRGRDAGVALPEPESLRPPATWPASDMRADWRMAMAVDRGAAFLARHATVGEAAARARLEGFVAERLARYPPSATFPHAARHRVCPRTSPGARYRRARSGRRACGRGRRATPARRSFSRSSSGASSPGT